MPLLYDLVPDYHFSFMSLCGDGFFWGYLIINLTVAILDLCLRLEKECEVRVADILSISQLSF